MGRPAGNVGVLVIALGQGDSDNGLGSLRRGRDKTIYSRSASGPSATMAMRSPSICERCPVGARDRAEPWTAS